MRTDPFEFVMILFILIAMAFLLFFLVFLPPTPHLLQDCVIMGESLGIEYRVVGRGLWQGCEVLTDLGWIRAEIYIKALYESKHDVTQ